MATPTFNEVNTYMEQQIKAGRNITYDQAKSELMVGNIQSGLKNVQSIFGGVTDIANSIFDVFGSKDSSGTQATTTTGVSTTTTKKAFDFTPFIVPAVIVGGLLVLVRKK